MVKKQELRKITKLLDSDRDLDTEVELLQTMRSGRIAILPKHAYTHRPHGSDPLPATSDTSSRILAYLGL